MGFHPHNAINSLFYRTQWINLDRYGRSQHSPVLGLGDYPLKNWFHLSLPASLIYANAGAVTTLVCTLMWAASNLVWAEHVDAWWTIAVFFTLFFSTTAYAMAFARQNYQMLGWMWLPLALFFTHTEQPILASLAWFAAGLSGITPVFFSIPIVFTLAVVSGNLALPLILIPALTYTVMRFLPLLRNGDGKRALNNIAKLIGATQSNLRYHRGMQRVGLLTLYFTALYLCAALLMSFSLGAIAVLPLLGALLFFVNQRFVRVADEQSLIVIASTLFVFSAIQAQPGWLTLVALWLAVNPIGWLLSIQNLGKDGGDGRILVNAPFDHTELEAGVREFLAQAAPGDRVYFSFDDPKGQYANIFDGYRVIHELPLQIASSKEVHLFPDWWAVAETNYEDAPKCWGRSVHEVIENCDRWQADFAIIYQESGKDLDEQWTAGFHCVSEFDWADYLHLLRGASLWSKDKPTPKWFLLRRAGHRSLHVCEDIARQSSLT